LRERRSALWFVRQASRLHAAAAPIAAVQLRPHLLSPCSCGLTCGAMEAAVRPCADQNRARDSNADARRRARDRTRSCRRAPMSSNRSPTRLSRARARAPLPPACPPPPPPPPAAVGRRTLPPGARSRRLYLLRAQANTSRALSRCTRPRLSCARAPSCLPTARCAHACDVHARRTASLRLEDTDRVCAPAAPTGCAPGTGELRLSACGCREQRAAGLFVHQGVRARRHGLASLRTHACVWRTLTRARATPCPAFLFRATGAQLLPARRRTLSAGEARRSAARLPAGALVLRARRLACATSCVDCSRLDFRGRACDRHRL
jgi:hypothetical protein